MIVVLFRTSENIIIVTHVSYTWPCPVENDPEEKDNSCLIIVLSYMVSSGEPVPGAWKLSALRKFFLTEQNSIGRVDRG